MYVVNITSVNDYMQCRYRWYCKWVLNRVPRDEPEPFTFGKVYHRVFEDFHAGTGTMAEVVARHRAACVEAVQTPENAGPAANSIAVLDEYREIFENWRDTYQFEIPVLEVEQPFQIESPFNPEIGFKGRPDRVGVLWGRLFHVQNRSLAAGTNFGLYLRLAKRSLHEHVYAYALSLKYPDYDYGGTIFNFLRKLKYRSKPTKKHPEGRILHSQHEIMSQQMMNISREDNRKMLFLATQYAEEMQVTHRRVQDEGTIPLPNEKLNGGPFGNSIDPYFLVLTGERSLWDDTLFKDRTDTYAPTA